MNPLIQLMKGSVDWTSETPLPAAGEAGLGPARAQEPFAEPLRQRRGPTGETWFPPCH